MGHESDRASIHNAASGEAVVHTDVWVCWGYEGEAGSHKFDIEEKFRNDFVSPPLFEALLAPMDLDP
jgi:ornithine carbamoyltransferase